MPPSPRPLTPRQPDDLDMTAVSAEPSPRNPPTSPVRFATSKNAFGLHASPSSSSTSSTREDRNLLVVEQSPPMGSTHKPRLRRPSMLSLAQNASFGSESEGGGDEMSNTEGTGPGPPVSAPAGPAALSSSAENRGGSQAHINPFAPTSLRYPPQWGSSAFTLRSQQESRTNHPTFEGLSTTTPPTVTPAMMPDQSGPEADMEDPQPKPPLRWVPSHLQTASARRKGKSRMEDQLIIDPSPQPELHRPPFTGRPLPASLLATLMSESAPGDHEIQSEARLQRLISSHPRALPFTPRASRSQRGRFPETVGDDEDDDDFPNRRAIWAARAWTRRDSSSDSDSDDMPVDEGPPEPVNSAFAAGMDMDRLISGSDSWPHLSDSGRVTPSLGGGSGSGTGSAGYPTPPSNGQPWDKSRSARMSFSAGLVPSPGTGFGLPNAFGGLGMGTGTPMGSPTVEKLELAASPGAHSAMSTASPSLMQYRESSGGSASVRPGKRKAQVDDRFDPYKRHRGSSPSLPPATGYPMSPSRPTAAIPIPPSPGYNLYSTMLSTSTSTPGQGGREQINLRTKANHPYTRPMASRSRAASPALSIGSTSGSLGTGGGGLGSGRGSFALGGAFNQVNNGGPGVPAPALGGLGLLSLAHRGEEVRMIKEDREGEEGEDMGRTDSGMGSERMEED